MYKEPKLDWENGNGVMTSDFERVEGNTQEIRNEQSDLQSPDQLRTNRATTTFNMILSRENIPLGSAEVQNIMLSHRAPTAADGEVGDLWIQYRT